MDTATLEQRLEWLQTGLREIGLMCLRLGGNDATQIHAPPPAEGIPPIQPSTPAKAQPGVGDAAIDPVVAAGVTSLSQFLSGVQDLTPTERLVVVDAAITMLSQIFVHLPLKRAMHGIDPLQRLRLLKQRSEAQIRANEAADSARGFHDEMIDVFHSLRDLHTNYILPSSYRGRTAFLPFLVQEYFDGQPLTPHFIVTKVQPGFVHDTFKVGVKVTHWNGIPIGRAVELNAAREAGSNSEARHARGLEALTLRPMALTAPPDESWVIIGYESGAQKLELRFDWQVTTAAPSASGADVDDSLAVAGEAAYVMGFDAETLAVHRARRSLFFPEAIDQEQQMAQVMASSPAIAALSSSIPSPSGVLAGAEVLGFDVKGEELRHAKRTVLFHDMAAAQQGISSVAGGETAGADLNTTSLLPEFFTFRRVTTPSGEFGYIRIYSFMALDANAFVAEFVRIAKLLPQNGLIVDVRGNGGGNIWAGERLLQLLTTKRIEPERFHFINSPSTLKLCQNDPRLADWLESIELSLETGEVYSQGFPLTSVDSANSLTDRYSGKVILVIDALCYSTTDIFSAGFQDHEIGKILGTSGRTGAGGANVWTYDFFTQLPQFTPNLPKGVSFRTAIRRSTRIGARAGVPLEDLGVRPDAIHHKTRRDILESNADLIAKAAEMLVTP